MNKSTTTRNKSQTHPCLTAEAAPQPVLDLSRPNLDLGQAMAGEWVGDFLYLLNRGTAPLTLTDIWTVHPFTARLAATRVAPGRHTRVSIGLEVPEACGPVHGVVELLTDDPWKPVVTIPVSAEAVVMAKPIPVDSVKLLLREGAIFRDQAGITLNYTVELPPTGPGRGEGSVDLGLSDSLPEGVEAAFSADRLPLGARELSELALFIPAGTVKESFSFWVTGEAMLEGESFPMHSPPFCVPEEIFFAPDDKPCDCPPKTPAATLERLVIKSEGLPDASPPSGIKPADNPVATVTAEIQGPKKGQCCKEAKFVFTLRVDSRVGANNNGLTGLFLASGKEGAGGFGITAGTNGAVDKVTYGPDNVYDPTKDGVPGGATDLTTFKRVQLQVMHEVPVTCTPPLCQCAVARRDYKTRFELTGPEKGGIEVYWSVAVTGQNCVIKTVTGTVQRIVYTRGGNRVFDPGRNQYVLKSGDDDGDGASNYDEIVKGTKADDPASKP